MKKYLLTHLLTIACTLGIITLNAQNISIVTNPNAPGIFAWTGSGALSGYAGTPIILKNSLVLEYNATGTSDPALITVQLAVYDGTSYNIIPNPDGGQGVYFQSVQIIHNDSLFFIYLDASGVQRLASFDGSAITLYPNPDAGLGYLGSPRIFNNALYVAYSNAAGATQFGKFNGTGISLIPNPDASTTGFFNNYSMVFDNKLCSRYVTVGGAKQLATFDGTSWTILPNPDATVRGVQPIFPIIYHSKLYWIYFSTANQYQWMQYDGTSNPTLIANPEDDGAVQGGVTNFPIINDDTLFFQYQDITGAGRLAKFDGATITLVPNPDATPYGFFNTPIVYNNQLYIFYVTPDQLHHLSRYESDGDSLKVYPNPDMGNGYWDQPIVYGNKLFFMYYNDLGIFQLGYFDGGNSINLITNPAGVYNGAAGNTGYVGQPIIWNNLLYMQFGSVPYGNAGNLASFNGSILPITLLGFTAQKQGNTSLLQWKVANEVKNSYFSVEHSPDGTNFQPIGKVIGHGTVSTQQQYEFTDNNPFKGLNFYRLKQVDIDGKFTYSNIVTITFTKAAVFQVFPNPAVNSVKITLPSIEKTSVMNVYDMYGKKVMEKEIAPNTNFQSLDVSKLPVGVYQFTLVQGMVKQNIKVVKE